MDLQTLSTCEKPPRLQWLVYTELTARTTAPDTRSALIGTGFTARLAGYKGGAHDRRPRENLEKCPDASRTSSRSANTPRSTTSSASSKSSARPCPRIP